MADLLNGPAMMSRSCAMVSRVIIALFLVAISLPASEHEQIILVLKSKKSWHHFTKWDFNVEHIFGADNDTFEKVATFISRGSNAQKVIDEVVKSANNEEMLLYNLQLATVLLRFPRETKEELDLSALKLLHQKKQFDEIIRKHPDLLLNRRLDDLVSIQARPKV